ncbi:hypothetical protein DIPPA_16310 [Diplonema papillatum]|nr:hypothetical protein DIPPA_16310 [Diplonema papillatum]
MEPKQFSQLLSHELQIGVDSEGGGTVGEFASAERALASWLHDAVGRKRASTDELAGVALSLRCFHGYNAYAQELKEREARAAVEDLDAVQGQAETARYAGSVWSLIHAVAIDTTRLPSAGYLDFFRVVNEGSLLSTAYDVHAMCEKSLASLPPVATASLGPLGEAYVDPLTKLHHAITFCMSQCDDVVAHSQIVSIAHDWCTWIAEEDAVLDYTVGLAKLSRSGLLSRLLALIHMFLVLGNQLPLHFQSLGLVKCLSEAFQQHASVMELIAEAAPEAQGAFAAWRSKVHQVYNDYSSTEQNAGEGLDTVSAGTRQEVAGTPLESLVDTLLIVLDIVSVSADLTEPPHDGGKPLLQWHEFLAALTAYLHPMMTITQLRQWVVGEHSLFHQMRMTEAEMNDIPADEKVTIQVLRGELVDVVKELDGCGVPGLTAHLLESLASAPGFTQDADEHAKLVAMRDRAFSLYASDLVQRSRASWRIALDYTIWTGGEEGQSTFLCILPSLSVNSTGLDHIINLYDLWRPHDSQQLVHSAIKNILAEHGYVLMRRGLCVEAMRRLLQAGHYEGVEEELISLLNDWASSVLRQSTPSYDSLADASPLISLAEAFNTQSLFRWPSSEEARRKANVFFSDPPFSFLDLLSITPLIANLSTAVAENNGKDLRKAALTILREVATPTLLKLAVLKLLRPLLNDCAVCYFSNENIGMLAGVLEDCLNEANLRSDLLKDVAASDLDDFRLALVRGASKAVCFSVPQAHKAAA